MILNSQFSVCCFGFIKSSIFRDSKDIIVIIQWIWIVLIKELLILFFTFCTMLIEEFLECLVCIRIIVFMTHKFIIMGSFVSIREDFKGLSNLMELSLSLFSVLFMLVRMPLRSQLFIGILNFKEGSIFWDSKDRIVILERLLRRHWILLLNF